jgi:hypothetical protein
MTAGDSCFFEHRPNLSHLVLADCAKSHATTTADLLDRIEVSWTRWSVWPDLLMDLAVFGCATVTEPHLATATGVREDVMGVSDRQKTAIRIKGFIANGKHSVLENFDARFPILDSDHQSRYPRIQGCRLFCVV